MIRFVLSLLAASFLCPPAGWAADRDSILFRYANAQNATDPRSLSMEFFKKELEGRTGSRIKVENYDGVVSLESVYHPDGGTYEEGFRASVGRFKEIFG